MNHEPLFGMKTGVIGRQTTALIRTFLQKKYDLTQSDSIPLTAVPSPLYDGLQLIRRGGDQLAPPGKGLVVGSVRMGYGHHRMALSVYSHSLAQGKPTFLHDLLAVESKESEAIADIDHGYSYFSRLASDLGGVVEWMWGQIMAQGNISSLDLSVQLADLYKNLMRDISRDNPVITTYPLNGQIAVANGFKKVIHLICDNFPQHFLLVPGAINLVQTPSAYKKFISMGVPSDSIAYAGHWVSHDLVKNAIPDSQVRIKRVQDKKKKRFLIPIGGAGAQKGFVSDLLKLSTADLVREKISFFINTGDHTKVFSALEEVLAQLKIPFESILTWEEMKSFLQKFPLDEEDKSKLPPIVLFNFPTHTEAFSATDILMRVSDVLVTKPSELAFFPIPKLFIRRVGDHEAASVLRSQELGEGTSECREPEIAYDWIKKFQSEPDHLLKMNENIIRASDEDVYGGSRKAVQLALE